MKAAHKPVRKGQSLVEAIAAVAMMVLVVTALVGLAVGALRTATVSRNRSRAVSYAQEGIERVRALRDQNPGNWVAFASDCESPGLASLPSPFDRTIDCSESAGVMKVEVSVSWTDALGDQSVDLDTYLTNWR